MPRNFNRTSKGQPCSTRQESRTNARIPTSNALLRRLLSKRWAYLHKDLSAAEEGQYPGVYILAYSKKDLKDKPIRIRDIFYVGMSHAGVVKRLGRFIKGLEENKYHSAAKRFFRTYGMGSPFSQLRRKKTFFFASVSVPCNVVKTSRTPLDLRKMGEVAKCEFYVLAHIKEKRRREPKLNLK